MPDKLDEILAEVKELKHWLYGKNGFEGDIPEIRKTITNHSKRIRNIEIVLATIIGAGGLTGGAVGLVKLLG